MTQQLALPGDEQELTMRTVRFLAMILFIAMIIAIIMNVVISLYDSSYPVFYITVTTAVIAVADLLAFIMSKTRLKRFASYYLVTILLAQAAVISSLFGGFAGPMPIIFLFPILVSGLLKSTKSSFLVASLAAILYLGIIPLENAGLLPQIMPVNKSEAIIVYLTVNVRVIFFYLVAFLSWYAAKGLRTALESTRQYATELQAANEKLQASEEELRTSNEELEAANEELRATEEELRASNEELETANEELKEAQEQLVRSEKLAAIGQLAGGVGHELRNPLGAIKNAVYYIRGKVGSSDLARQEPRVMEFLGIVDDEIASSNKIINDLLSFSRVGKPAASPARIEMVVDDAVAHSSLPESVGLTREVDGSLPEVEMDTEQIRQVLVNIITNAVQAMPDGGKLTIAAKAADGFLELAVTDTGQGIPEKAAGKIFDPLYTMKAKGIGLGLAVCKSIMERHGGQIGVESEVGKGATFTLKLPLKAE